MNREVIPGNSPFFEPWMLPEEKNEEDVTDFRLWENVNCDVGIALRNVTCFHCSLKHFAQADF